MRNIDVAIHYIVGLPHFLRKGHWPSYYELGGGERYLTCCARGGGRSHSLFALARAHATLGAR